MIFLGVIFFSQNTTKTSFIIVLRLDTVCRYMYVKILNALIYSVLNALIYSVLNALIYSVLGFYMTCVYGFAACTLSRSTLEAFAFNR